MSTEKGEDFPKKDDSKERPLFIKVDEKTRKREMFDLILLIVTIIFTLIISNYVLRLLGYD